MATQRLWLRAGYALRGALPRRPVGWHAVSERVAVDVGELSPDEAPVAVAFERPASAAEVRFRAAYLTCEGLYDRHRPGPVPTQSWEVRLGPDGLLCPLLGPDCEGRVAAADLGALADRVAHHLRTRCPEGPTVPDWRAYPGTHPSSQRRVRSGSSHDWPAASPDAPGRPAFASPDPSELGLRDHDALGREASLAAFARAASGLKVIAGEVWRPCGTPVLVMDRIGTSPRVVIPGHDAPVLDDVDLLQPMGCFDARTPLRDLADVPDHPAHGMRWELDVPFADVGRENLTLALRSVDECLADVAWKDLHRRMRPLLGTLSRVPDVSALFPDQVPDAYLNELLDAVDDARRSFARTPDDAPQGRDGLVLARLGVWADATRAEVAMVQDHVPAQEDDHGLSTIRM